MSETLEVLKARLGTLPSRDRAELVEFLINSLEPESESESDINVEVAWEAELARRAAEIRAGRVQGKSADQVFAELRAEVPVKPVRFHPEAEAELTAAIVYYEGQRAGLGVNLRQEVEAAAGLIGQNPQLFPARGTDGFRKCPVRRFPYAIYYLDRDTEIWIAAIAHRSRRPGYWTSRSPT